ncbi:GL14459 [Drosophila persimilis]|uniref:GL14459 n=1 Tax=Drosophila persimilis TaxID=7234 RepID=B4GU11_DROPE|nr:GL14459 [Drosophila persimilis]
MDNTTAAAPAPATANNVICLIRDGVPSADLLPAAALSPPTPQLENSWQYSERSQLADSNPRTVGERQRR